MKLAVFFTVLTTLTITQASAQAPAAPTPEAAPAAEASPSADSSAASVSASDETIEMMPPVRIERRSMMTPSRRSGVRRSSSRDSFLGRVIELERRKNAWLMRTFFGR